MLQGPLDFIKSIQEAKKAQELWAKTEPAKRLELLRNVHEFLQTKPRAKDLAQAQNLPQSFVEEVEYLNISLKLEETTATPTGMISILLPENLGLRFLIQKAMPALLAGNGLFIKTSQNNFVPGEIFKAATQDLPPNLVNIFHGNEELGSLLATHPGVHAVTAMGKASTIENIIKGSVATFKKLQLHGDFHNSALILNEALISEVVPKLIHSAFTGMGFLRYNVNNVLITESRLEEFESVLKSALEKTDFLPLNEKQKVHINELKAKAKAENGKVIFDKADGPLVIRDMSHCSTLQSDCLRAPILLVSPVKYIHEMVKWTNTGSLGELAQIFGPEEKVQKFGMQLEVGNIVGGAWIGSSALAAGMKQSFYGIRDESAFGSFFSNLRRFS